MHTKEGFRKTSELNSIMEELKYFNNSCDVYCLGGSTTYCDGIRDFSDSWPYKLRVLMNKDKESFLFSWGVGFSLIPN